MMMKVSVIIPMYNVEQFIRNCLSSVLNQIYQNIEIILIDDCSTDSTREIVKSIIKDEKVATHNIIYKHHVENKGIAFTRNEGLRLSTGDYIFFLDADDYITSTCISSLLSFAEKYPNVDVVQGNVITGNNPRIRCLPQDLPTYEDNRSVIYSYMYGTETRKSIIPNVVWNKLIRKEFIVQNNYWFLNGIIHEDLYWLMNYWRYVNSICFCLEPTYFYRYNPTSITSSSSSEYDSFRSLMIIYKEILPSFMQSDLKYVEKQLIEMNHLLRVKMHDVNFSKYRSVYRETLIMMLCNRLVPVHVKIVLVYMLFPIVLVKNRVIATLL